MSLGNLNFSSPFQTRTSFVHLLYVTYLAILKWQNFIWEKKNKKNYKDKKKHFLVRCSIDVSCPEKKHWNLFGSTFEPIDLLLYYFVTSIRSMRFYEKQKKKKLSWKLIWYNVHAIITWWLGAQLYNKLLNWNCHLGIKVFSELF